MKTTLACVLMALMALIVSGCGSSPQDLVVGKWETTGTMGVKLTAEFAKDGKAKLTMPMIGAAQGTYKVKGDDLEWTVGTDTKKFKMKVTATELELSGDGQTITYKRV